MLGTGHPKSLYFIMVLPGQNYFLTVLKLGDQLRFYVIYGA